MPDDPMGQLTSGGTDPGPTPTPSPEAVAGSPAAPLTPTLPETFEIDGRPVARDALFQTYRQFPHLQSRWTKEAKPWVDFATRHQLSPDLIPALERYLVQQFQAKQAGTTPPEPALDLKAIEAAYPELMPLIRGMQTKLDQMERLGQTGMNQLRDLLQFRQELQVSEQARGAIQTLQTSLTKLADEFPDLKRPEVSRQVVQTIYQENWPVSQLTERNIRRVALDLLGESLLKRRQGQAAFGEGGTARMPAAAKPTEMDQTIGELLSTG